MMFRLRAQRLFAVWAHAWTVSVTGEHAAKRDDIDALCCLIQEEYCTTLFRNPTVPEWTRDFLRHRKALTPRIGIVRELLARAQPQPADSIFNPSKPWWLRLQIAGRHEQTALQTFSEDVGRAFLAASGKDVALSSHVDWTDEENIKDFLGNLPKPLKTKPFQSFWKKLHLGLDKVCR